MAKDYPRTVRIAEQLHRELAGLVRDEVRDPRIGMVTLMDVEVSRDLAHARVYFSILEASPDIEVYEAGLNHAAGFLRRLLAKRLPLRTIPELKFIYDNTQRQGARIDRLINEALDAPKDAPKDGQGDDNEGNHDPHRF